MYYRKYKTYAELHKVHKIIFNQLYFCYFFTKSYVWPLVRRDDSNKWTNIGLDEEIGIIAIKWCQGLKILKFVTLPAI